jgi:hypothetical protein
MSHASPRDVLGDSDGLIYMVMQPEHLDTVVDTVANAFTEGEPTSAYNGMSQPGNWEIYTRLYATRMATEQLSVVAVDRESKEVLGRFSARITRPHTLQD